MAELTALENPGEISKVFELFRKNFSDGEPVPTNIGYHGGSRSDTVFWHKDLNIWSFFLENWRSDPEVYGCIFGIGDPGQKRSNNITLEINYDHSNPRRSVGGRFLKSGKQYFIGHSGKIGGSKKGQGKSEFLKCIDPENLVTVLWHDQTEEDILVISSLSDPLLKTKIAEFVSEVADFKNRDFPVVANTGPIEKKSEPAPYTDEFFGVKRYETPGHTIVVKTHHGLVVRSLKDQLKKLGYSSTNDRVGTLARDLYIPSHNNEAKIVFEIKTEISPVNLYTGIGQLMFHGAWQTQIPRRILVIPKQPTDAISKILKNLNIEILLYDLNSQGATFPQVENIISNI